MTRNLFDGESYYVLFALKAYKWLISRAWVTYADIMADYLGLQSAKELKGGVSYYEQYGELKKAFSSVRRAIIDIVGEGCFEEEGNNRNKRFRYVGQNQDPLADMRTAKVINSLRQYWEFCQNSAGFFPTSWLEYYFRNSQDLLDIKIRRRKGEQVISTSLDRVLENIEYLPMLFEAIKNKRVLEIDYKPYDGELESLIFHPHYLKEYNGRWHLLGHCDGHLPEHGYNLSLDRIQNQPRERSKHEYIPAPPMFYESFFKDIVGLTLFKNAELKEIVIRAHSYQMFMLTDTKKIHESQTIIKPFGEHEDGTYGDFTVRVKLNNEFIGRILQMGDGLEVVAPIEVRAIFKKKVDSLSNLYRDD